MSAIRPAITLSLEARCAIGVVSPVTASSLGASVVQRARSRWSAAATPHRLSLLGEGRHALSEVLRCEARLPELHQFALDGVGESALSSQHLDRVLVSLHREGRV